MQKYLPKHLAKKSIALPEFSPKKRKKDWRGKPESWPDIRKNVQDGHIYLLVDDRYPIGFVATATDGYSVAIDGEHYGDYASNAQFSMADWTEYTDTQGYDITEPTGATKAHIIDVYPQTESDNITSFKMTDRTSLLWLHSNISTEFNSLMNFVGSTTGSSLIKAVTSKNNIVKSKDMRQAFGKCPNLEYLPVLNFANSTAYQSYLFYSQQSYSLKKVVIKNLKQTGDISNSETFMNCYGLKEIILQNSSFCWYVNSLSNLFSLKKLPKGIYHYNGSLNFNSASSLEPTDLDCSTRTTAKTIRVYGTNSHPMYGIKSLKIANQAPLNEPTPPQVNIAYTGLNRIALVQLFNDLPTVSDGQIINITGCSGAADLTEEEALIPDSKGWTLTR